MRGVLEALNELAPAAPVRLLLLAGIWLVVVALVAAAAAAPAWRAARGAPGPLLGAASKKLMLVVPTGIVAVLLSVAPMIAQEMQDTDAATPGNDSRRDHRVDTDEDGLDLGWLGLLGLVGLAGLMRRDRHDHTISDKTTHR